MTIHKAANLMPKTNKTKKKHHQETKTKKHTRDNAREAWIVDMFSKNATH